MWVTALRVSACAGCSGQGKELGVGVAVRAEPGCSGQGKELGVGVAVHAEQSLVCCTSPSPARDPFTGGGQRPSRSDSGLCVHCPSPQAAPSILQLLGRHSSVFEGNSRQSPPSQKPLFKIAGFQGVFFFHAG